MIESTIGPFTAVSDEVRVAREDFPALYIVASEVSRMGQRAYKRAILTNLLMVVVAAILGAVASWVPDRLRASLAIIIAAVFLAAILTKMLSRQGGQDWFDGRAVAESVKSNAWRYMMRIPPFRADWEADTLFFRRMTAIQTDYKGMSQNLAAVQTDMHQISPRMKQLRKLDWVTRRDEYTRFRLKGQVEWYRGKSIQARKESRLWGWASVVAEATGMILALSVLVLPAISMTNMIGVAAAVAASFQAWAQVGRHDELSRSYAMACQELVAIGDLMRDAKSEDAFVRAVEYSEEAISREHTMWVTKRTV